MSAFTLPRYPGRIYIEVRELSAIWKLIGTWSDVFTNSMMVIPIDERAQLLQRSWDKHLPNGLWAKVKRGKYKGDLALVRDATHCKLRDEGTSSATVLTDLRTIAVVPRIDIQSASQTKSNKRKRTGHKMRPSMRPFDPITIENSYGIGSVTRKSDGSFIFRDQVYRGGLLELKVQGTHSLEYTRPTRDEVAIFAACLSRDGNPDIFEDSVTRISNIRIDDALDILFGPYSGASGHASSSEEEGFVRVRELCVNNDVVFPDDISIPARDLRPRREIGDQVTIIDGQYCGHQGLVVNIDTEEDRLDIYDTGIRKIVCIEFLLHGINLTPPFSRLLVNRALLQPLAPMMFPSTYHHLLQKLIVHGMV